MIENYEQNYEQIKSPKQSLFSVEIQKTFYKNLNKQIIIFRDRYCVEKGINKEYVKDVEIYEAIAEKVNVKYNTISRWHKAEMLPDMENIIKLARALNCTVDELLTGENRYQQYLEALEEKGISKYASEIIEKEIRATIPKCLFEIQGYIEPVKVDFFTVLNYMVENKEIFIETLERSSKEIEKIFRKLTDLEKYKDILSNSNNNNIKYEYLGQEISYYEDEYNKLKNSLPDDIKIELEKSEKNINKYYKMFISAYIVYLFNEVYKNHNSKESEN